nr:efflux RND transporter permease subunit [Lachnospiraceae bacterium]
EGISSVTFQFVYGTDLGVARTQLQEALEDAKIEFPEGISSPNVVSMNNNADASISLSVDSDKDIDVRAIVKQQVVPELKKIGDAAGVKWFGGNERYISIELKPDVIAQYGLSVASVSEMIAAANMEMAVGSVAYGDQTINVNTKVKYADIDALRNIPISLKSGDIIHVYDIAIVRYADMAPDSYSRFNGKDNISIDITKKQKANVIALSKEVKAVLERIKEKNPDLNIQIVFDSSDSIVKSIKSIAETLFLGIGLSMLVLFVFFGDLKASLIVGSSMPISLLATFICMNKMGFTLNMITMSALVIGIGMMVDNAIVVIEMCFRKKDEGYDFKEAAYEGTKVVVASIFASTMTTVVVYLPLAGLQGMSGQMYSPLGYTIVFALLASLISALTLIPLCFSRYRPVERKKLAINTLLGKLSERYGKRMPKVLRRKLLITITAFVLIGLSAYLATQLQMELMEAADERQIGVTLTFKPGLSLAGMNEISRHVEEFVAKDSEVENYSVMVSKEENNATINAYLKKSRVSTAQVIDRWNKELAHYDDRCDVKVSLADPEGMGDMGGGNVTEIALKSSNLENLKEASKQVEAIMANTPGVLYVQNTLLQGGFKAEVVIDPDLAQSRGFTTTQLGEMITNQISGKKALDVTVDDRKFEARVELPKELRDDINSLESLSFYHEETNVFVPFGEVAHIEYKDAPQSITRTNGQYEGSVKATLPADKAYEMGEALQSSVKAIALPENVSFGETQAEESMEEEFSGIGKAIASAVFLVFMVMAIQFESIRYSVLVMFCIPFSVIGSIPLLYLTNSKLNMTSLMGFLMLAGIVVNNGILLIDTTNENRKAMPVEEALITAGKSRLRPILMTTLTTILSMVPMCIPRGGSEDSMKGMALVIIGGLTASTILTFFLLPTFYMIIQKKEKVSPETGQHAEIKTETPEITVIDLDNEDLLSEGENEADPKSEENDVAEEKG